MLSSPSHQDTIVSMCNTADVPRHLAARADIQRHVIRYTLALEGQVDSRTRNSIIQLYDQEIGSVQKCFSGIWSDDLEVEFQGARLNLYGFSLLPCEAPADLRFYRPEALSTSSRVILQLGLAAAVRLTHVSCRMKIPKDSCLEGRSYSENLILYPKHFFRLLAFAAFFLLWYLGVDVQSSDSDKELARNHVSAMYRLFVSFSWSLEHQRAAKSIEILGRMPNTAGEMTAPRIVIRLGASFMYNALRNCMIYGNRPNLGSPTPEPVPDASYEHAEEEYTITEAQQPGESYQMIEDFAGGWEFPFGVWNNAVYEEICSGTDFGEGLFSFGELLQ